MTPPSRIWHVEWVDDHGDHERRYRSAHRAAMQVASVLGVPPEVATLRGVWRVAGHVDERLRWERLDPLTLLREDRATFTPPDDDSERVDAFSWYERVRLLWAEAEDRASA